MIRDAEHFGLHLIVFPMRHLLPAVAAVVIDVDIPVAPAGDKCAEKSGQEEDRREGSARVEDPSARFLRQGRCVWEGTMIIVELTSSFLTQAS